jgi:putative transposase
VYHVNKKGGTLVFTPIHIPGDLYFVTGTIVEWEPLFINRSYANTILASLDWHRHNKRMFVFAFVLMLNHIHWISKPIKPYSINDNIQSFASFTAHKILKLSRLTEQQDLQNLFRKNAENGKRHKIWKNFQAKNIYTHRFLIQKMEYIHNNPIKINRFSSEIRAKYLYSSACYYDLGTVPIIPIDDIFDFLEKRDN